MRQMLRHYEDDAFILTSVSECDLKTDIFVKLDLFPSCKFDLQPLT